MNNLSFTSCTGFVKVRRVLYDTDTDMFVNGSALIVNINHIVYFEEPYLGLSSVAEDVIGPIFYIETVSGMGLKVTSQELTDLYKASGESR